MTWPTTSTKPFTNSNKAVTALSQQHCINNRQELRMLDATSMDEYLAQLDGWGTAAQETALEKAFRFKDFYQTIAFVNAIAWIANSENHHPDLEVGYNRCLVRYTTHDIGGISINDFICAARIDALNL